MKKKIVILGCENSHANTFLTCLKENPKYEDVEVIGVYSDEEEEVKILCDTYGVYAMKSYDEFVGKVDGVIVTARHGDNHYKYAKPYIESGVPMFIDKPITMTEEDALKLARDLKKYNVPVSGGSMLKYAMGVQGLKKSVQEYGKIMGGYVRAPYTLDNGYGGFKFYAQHLVQMLTAVFGFFPKAVRVAEKNDHLTVLFRYEDYDVTGAFYESVFRYAIFAACEHGTPGEPVSHDRCGLAEFDVYYELLHGAEPEETYEEFISAVFIMNAIERALESGKEEPIHTYTI